MGVDARGFPGGLLRLDPAFAYVEPLSSWPLSWAEYLTLAPNKCLSPLWASLVAQMVKCMPTIQESRIWSLGQEDPLEKEMATHSSTLAWKIPWMEESGGLQSMGLQRGMTERLHFLSLSKSLTHFLIRLLLICRSFLCMLDINLIS